MFLFSMHKSFEDSLKVIDADIQHANTLLNPSVNLFSKSMQRGVVEHRWEMDIQPCLAIDFNIENIPVKIDWEESIPRGTPEWE